MVRWGILSSFSALIKVLHDAGFQHSVRTLSSRAQPWFSVLPVSEQMESASVPRWRASDGGTRENNMGLEVWSDLGSAFQGQGLDFPLLAFPGGRSLHVALPGAGGETARTPLSFLPLQCVVHSSFAESRFGSLSSGFLHSSESLCPSNRRSHEKVIT